MERPEGHSTLAYWMVGSALLLLIMGTNVPSTLYGIYREEWGFSAGVLTLVFATYVAGLIPSLLLFGHLSDSFGRRWTVLFGMAIAGAGALVFLFAQGLVWLFVARFVQGVAVGVVSGAATASLAELQPDGDMKAAALMSTAALTTGGGIGPIFGAVFAEYAPFPLTVPYVAYLILFAPVALCLLAVMPDTTDAESKVSWRPRQPRIPKEILRPFLLGSGACFLVWAVVGFYSSLIPTYLMSLMDTRNLTVGGGLIFLMFASSLAAQLSFRDQPSLRTIILGCTVTVIGMAMLVVAAPLDAVPALIAASVLSGVGVGFGFRGGMEIIGRVAPSESRAEVTSAAYAILYAGVGLPTVLVGFASDRFGLFTSVIGLTAVLFVLTTVVALASLHGVSSQK